MTRMYGLSGVTESRKKKTGFLRDEPIYAPRRRTDVQYPFGAGSGKYGSYYPDFSKEERAHLDRLIAEAEISNG